MMAQYDFKFLNEMLDTKSIFSKWKERKFEPEIL